ncbi:MAG: cupredoxin domain-containing protein [Actinomycetota bacterium]|nr:cupredoxin domain-containing protein [Actinomycetota bacterium]
MRRGFVMAAVLASVLLTAFPAQAASVVQVQDFSFSPTPLTVPQGTSVTWHNNGPTMHTSTSDLGLWNTGTLAPGATSGAVVFKAAGLYAYHCKIHPSMHGKVRVPVKVSPASGSTSTVFTIALAAGSRAHWSFDVQKKAGAGLWKIWKTGVTSLSVTFSHASPGTWRFRSRLHRNGSTLRTGWSPSKMITIS